MVLLILSLAAMSRV